MEEENKCTSGHQIKGITPMLHQLEYDGKVCDCNRIIFKSIPCGCPGNNKTFELKEIPNE